MEHQCEFLIELALNLKNLKKSAQKVKVVMIKDICANSDRGMALELLKIYLFLVTLVLTT